LQLFCAAFIARIKTHLPAAFLPACHLFWTAP
jgi:hypothetical protein